MKAEIFFAKILERVEGTDFDVWFEIHGWRVDICVGNNPNEVLCIPVRASRKDED